MSNSYIDIYKPIYDEMQVRNHRAIKAEGVKSDKLLNNSTDARQGVGIFAEYDQFHSENFQQIYEEAKQKFPNQVLYSPKLAEHPSEFEGQLHFTFFQVYSVPSEGNIPAEITGQMDNYAKVIFKTLSTLDPFEITFSGLMAIPTGLLLYGYPSQNINEYRDDLRQGLTQAGLPFREPYKTDIVHSTFLRLSNNVGGSSLLNFSKKYQKTLIGTATVKKMYFAFGSWRMQPSEVVRCYEFDLLDKKLRQL